MNSVIIVGFDGLQPSQVTPDRMPNLWEMGSQGVVFENHHSVFPTMTRVNVTSIQTGCYPGRHGLVANRVVVREFDPTRILNLGAPDLTEMAEATGELLFVPTLGEILAANDAEYVAVGIGGTGNAFVQHPHAALVKGASIHRRFTIPSELHESILSRFGPWPAGPDPDAGPSGLSISTLMGHAVKVLTEYVIADRDPALSLLWCGEPDLSQHFEGVGSEQAERSLRDADREFGRLLDWLRETGRESDTDVIVLSDHGYSSVKANLNIDSLLLDAGFPPGDQQGGVLAVPNGGAVTFYVRGREHEAVDRLASWLMEQPWCGAIVVPEAVGAIEGALPAALVGAEGPRAPDLAVSLAWDAEPTRNGYRGRIYSTYDHVGDHGSMSRQEVNNVMLARGPSFKSRATLSTPTSNVDVAPTVLRILGLPGGDEMDGRVVEEALAGGPEESEVESSTAVYEASRELETGKYHQQITVSTLGSASYPDEGSAVLESG